MSSLKFLYEMFLTEIEVEDNPLSDQWVVISDYAGDAVQDIDRADLDTFFQNGVDQVAPGAYRIPNRDFPSVFIWDLSRVEAAHDFADFIDQQGSHLDWTDAPKAQRVYNAFSKKVPK